MPHTVFHFSIFLSVFSVFSDHHPLHVPRYFFSLAWIFFCVCSLRFFSASFAPPPPPPLLLISSYIILSLKRSFSFLSFVFFFSSASFSDSLSLLPTLCFPSLARYLYESTRIRSPCSFCQQRSIKPLLP